MTNRVNSRNAGHIRIPPELGHETRKTKRSFDETLKTKEARAGDLPRFPAHRARAKSISTVQANRLARYAPVIQDAARRHNVPIELICGVILQESGGNPRAVSRTGAKGLMQLMDGTARRFGVHNSFDPVQNIDGGTRYLRWLLDHFNNNVELTLAAYNAGEKNVEKYGNQIPPFRETQNYVPNVLGYCLAMIDILSTPASPMVASREKTV